MITLDYTTKTKLADGEGKASATTREQFRDNEKGMLRFEELQRLIAEGELSIPHGIQLTWTPPGSMTEYLVHDNFDI